jgi:putative ABC transport system permease protein
MLSKIAFKELLFKPFQNLMLIVLIALAIAASVLVISLNQGLQKGLTTATAPFPQLIAAKGGSNQVILNTVFLQDDPVGNVSSDVFEAVQNSPHVEQAIPLAFGDNYRGFKVVGASEEIFSFIHQVTKEPWLSVAEGRAFNAPFEVVIGSKTAQMAELAIGDTFRSIHGASEYGMAHEDIYTVVGILEPIGGPYDQVILSSIESVWIAHDHDHEHEEHGHEGEEAHDHEHSSHGEVTAILVRPAGYGEAMRLAQEYQSSSNAQLIFPAQAVVRLFSMMGQGQQLWSYLGGFLIAIALLLVMVTLYLSGLNSLRERAILLSMGATPRELLKINLLQNTMIIAVGGLIGYLGGYAIYIGIANLINQRTAIELPLSFMSTPFLIALATVVAGLIVSIIPAFLLRRKNVLRFL